MAKCSLDYSDVRQQLYDGLESELFPDWERLAAPIHLGLVGQNHHQSFHELSVVTAAAVADGCPGIGSPVGVAAA